MKTLCIFANEFPYGSWEAYLETEVKFYSEFDKVYIFSLQLRKEHAKTKRSLPENFEVIPIWYAPKWKYLLNCVRVLGDVNLYKELFLLGKKGQLKIGRIIDLFIYLSRSNYEMRKIKKSVELQKLKNAIFYSYRFEYQPYVAMLLRKELKTDNKIISRAHRYDLYEEFRKNKYIPCRELLIKNLDAVYPCSEDGTCYLQSRFPKYKNKIKTRFLGTLSVLARSPIGRILNIAVYGGNTVENAMNGFSFAHALSYLVMGKQYLNGNGMGSSYIAEIMYSFGYMGVFIANIFYGVFLRKFFKLKKDKVWINTIIIIMMKSLFFAPRGSFDAFFSDLLSVNVWLTLIFVYLFSSMIYKNKKKTYAKRGRNV